MHSDNSYFQGGGGKVSAVVPHSVQALCWCPVGSLLLGAWGLEAGALSRTSEPVAWLLAASLFLPMDTVEAKGLMQPGIRLCEDFGTKLGS